MQALHAVYYTTVVTFPILVTIVFWGVLYESPWFPVRFDAWSNVRFSFFTFSHFSPFKQDIVVQVPAESYCSHKQ